jgi:hypothetical protein
MHVRDRERLMGAFLLAVLLHAAIFAAVHFIAPYVPERRPAYLGLSRSCSRIRRCL